jgi:hypothetical protein
MTPKFDKLVQDLLEEATRCKHPTLPTLSDHPNFRLMKCVISPYTSGVKRVHYLRKDGSFDYSVCDKPQRPGTERALTCKYYHDVKRKRRLLALKRKLEKQKDK